MTTITFQADEALLARGQAAARARQTTLDALFGEWLQSIGEAGGSSAAERRAGEEERRWSGNPSQALRELADRLATQLTIARKYSREEMNER